MDDRRKGTKGSKPATGASTKASDEKLIMAEIGRIINSSLLLDEVFEQVGDRIQKLISFDRFRINLLDNESHNLRNVFGSGIEIPEYHVGRSFPVAGSTSATVLESGRVSLAQGLNEVELSQEYPGMMPGFKAGLRSFLAVPLIFDDMVIGTIGIQSRRPNAYTNDDVLLAERVGSQISGAIVNAKLYSDLKLSEESQNDKPIKTRSLLRWGGPSTRPCRSPTSLNRSGPRSKG